MRILIVEDGEKLSRYLKKRLEESPCTVNFALNGVGGLYLETHETYAQNLREFKKQLIDIDISPHYTEYFKRLVSHEEELVSNRAHNRNHIKIRKGIKTS